MPRNPSPDDVRKSVVDSLSNPSEDIARHVLTMAGANPDRIEKAYSIGVNIVHAMQSPVTMTSRVLSVQELVR